jgi:SH3 domain-containing YSC84-like protein 1
LRAETAQERLQAATNVLTSIMSTPDKGIPRDLLESAHCAIIVPGLKKGAFIIGGQYGRGFTVCRKPGGAGWGDPAAIRMEGGSIGFQIGGQVTDLVMLVMNENGQNRLMQSKFTLGGDASVAAGPVGRTVEAKTDALMTAEILAWSRTGGAFVGISLSGSTLRPDEDENAVLYGKKMTTKEIVMGNLPTPAAAKPLLAVLNQYSWREEGTAARQAPEPTTKGKRQK